MLSETELLRLKNKYTNVDQLVRRVNAGSHCAAIKSARGLLLDESRKGTFGAAGSADALLELLLPCVTETVVLKDSDEYVWMTVADWARKHPKVNPKDAGWELEGDRLYRRKGATKPSMEAA